MITFVVNNKIRFSSLKGSEIDSNEKVFLFKTKKPQNKFVELMLGTGLELVLADETETGRHANFLLIFLRKLY